MAQSVGNLGPAELDQLVEGRSDAEIDESIASLGTDAVLARVFGGMRDAFRPERAAGQQAVLQWDLSTPDGARSWQLSVQDGAASVAEGTPATPRVTLGLGLADLLRFLAGRLDAMQAFMGGRLRVSGDLMLAQAMATWFDRSR